MEKIDIETWKRKTTYNNFIKYTNPVFSVGTRLDVTEFLKYIRLHKKSFFASFLYVVVTCANEIEELRYRIFDGEPVVYERIKPSYIVMLDNEELVTCASDPKINFDDFYDTVKKDIQNVKKRNVPAFNEEIILDCFYISCLPWTDFTSVINPYNFEDKDVTSIPRITWGKYMKNENGKTDIAIDVSVHHALIDGRQISEFYEKMQKKLLHPEEYIREDIE